LSDVVVATLIVFNLILCTVVVTELSCL